MGGGVALFSGDPELGAAMTTTTSPWFCSNMVLEGARMAINGERVAASPLRQSRDDGKGERRKQLELLSVMASSFRLPLLLLPSQVRRGF